MTGSLDSIYSHTGHVRAQSRAVPLDHPDFLVGDVALFIVMYNFF